MSTPEFIYLIPGEYEGYPEMVWCDDPAPSYADDPDDAVKYVRVAEKSEAFILRKQAEAIDAFLNHPVNFDIHDPAAIIKKLEVECKRLRNDADKAGGGDA